MTACVHLRGSFPYAFRELCSSFASIGANREHLSIRHRHPRGHCFFRGLSGARAPGRSKGPSIRRVIRLSLGCLTPLWETVVFISRAPLGVAQLSLFSGFIVIIPSLLFSANFGTCLLPRCFTNFHLQLGIVHYSSCFF